MSKRPVEWVVRQVAVLVTAIVLSALHSQGHEVARRCVPDCVRQCHGHPAQSLQSDLAGSCSCRHGIDDCTATTVRANGPNPVAERDGSLFARRLDLPTLRVAADPRPARPPLLVLGPLSRRGPPSV